MRKFIKKKGKKTERVIYAEKRNKKKKFVVQLAKAIIDVQK